MSKIWIFLEGLNVAVQVDFSKAFVYSALQRISLKILQDLQASAMEMYLKVWFFVHLFFIQLHLLLQVRDKGTRKMIGDSYEGTFQIFWGSYWAE